jgi:hypothetical protein
VSAAVVRELTATFGCWRCDGHTYRVYSCGCRECQGCHQVVQLSGDRCSAHDPQHESDDGRDFASLIRVTEPA